MFFSFQIQGFNLAVVKNPTKPETKPQNKLSRPYTIRTNKNDMQIVFW